LKRHERQPFFDALSCSNYKIEQKKYKINIKFRGYDSFEIGRPAPQNGLYGAGVLYNEARFSGV
jgi:hypothetical protein